MKKAVMYGAGNIGRGFIGQLFSLSGYEVVFIDVNPIIVDKLNEDNKYPIRIISDEGYSELVVENVRAVNGLDVEKAADEIASADIMATAVGANILPKIVNVLVKGLKKRWNENNFTPLNIIICENLLNANHYLEKLLKQELNDSEKEYLDKTVGLVEASIGRMVPVATSEMQGDNPLRVCVEEYCELPVDKDAFKGEIPDIINMVPFSPFDFYIQRKLFMHNMGHATMAYLGFLNNNSYIWEASRNSTIKLITLRAMLDQAVAMSREHGVPLEQLIDHSEDLLFRFSNRLLGDTVDRVGRDPVRKLAANDRLIGAANLCLKHGICPVYVSIGIAAAFMFANQDDEAAMKVQAVVQNEGLEAALKQFCGIDESSAIYKLVKDFYNKLKSDSSFEDVLRHAEKLKRTVKC
ncbi:MAG TPA: mannitol dehydrogenase [Clostridiaceae bacterium]|nr:mannitol dehydrogenase [Clostridiaceae bacterium]